MIFAALISKREFQMFYKNQGVLRGNMFADMGQHISTCHSSHSNFPVSHMQGNSASLK
jgi:hypothetical protein